MNKNKMIHSSIVLAVISFVLFSFGTIIIFQVPWMDEVFFADMTHSLLTKKTLEAPVDYPRVTGSVNIYGPIYFVLQAAIWKLLGSGMWQFRLLPIFSGLVIFGLGSFYIFKKTASHKYLLMFMLFFVFDRTINFFMHSGRMDMTASAFMFGSMLLFSRSLKLRTNLASVSTTLAAGLLLSASFLTTLRLGFAAIPCVLLLFLYKPESKGTYYRNLVIYGGLAVAAVILWLYYAFGGIAGAYSNAISLSVDSAHLGFFNSIFENIFRRSYEAPKMLFFYLCIAYLLFKKPEVIRKDFVFCMILCLVLGFVLFVKEHGGYRSNILPYIYILMIYAVHVSERRFVQKTGHWILIVLIGLNVLFYLPRLTYIARTLYQDGAIMQDIVHQLDSTIPVGSNVVAEYKYYYLLKLNGRHVITPHRIRKFHDEIAAYAMSPAGFSATHLIGDVQLKVFKDKSQFELIGFVGRKPAPISEKLKKLFFLEWGLRDSDYYDPVYKVNR